MPCVHLLDEVFQACPASRGEGQSQDIRFCLSLWIPWYVHERAEDFVHKGSLDIAA